MASTATVELSASSSAPKPAYLPARLAALAQRPILAYPTIFLLQLRAMWNIWYARDLTGGDTAGYFARAFEWFKEGKLSLAWSPLYNVFYGLMFYFSRDAYTVTILHRLVIVLVGTLMVLG